MEDPLDWDKYNTENPNVLGLILGTLQWNALIRLFSRNPVSITARDACTRVNGSFGRTGPVPADIAIGKSINLMYNDSGPPARHYWHWHVINKHHIQSQGFTPENGTGR